MNVMNRSCRDATKKTKDKLPRCNYECLNGLDMKLCIPKRAFETQSHSINAKMPEGIASHFYIQNFTGRCNEGTDHLFELFKEILLSQ